MNKKLILLLLLGAMSTTLMAQRHTDKLDRGLVAIPAGSTSGSTWNTVTWRRLTSEYGDVTYNLYKNGGLLVSGLTNTCYDDHNNGLPDTQYEVAAVVNGKVQARCAPVKPWTQYIYKLGDDRNPSAYIDIPLAAVNDREGRDVTSHYSPNDAEMADLDGDGQLEIIIKRLNDWDASDTGSPTGEYQTDEHGNYILDENGNKIPIYDGGIYSANSKEFVVIDAYDVNWQTGKATLMWRIDCGPNMVSLNSTEIDIIAYDWDEDGKAEVVLRGADDMIIHKSDGTTQTVGIDGFNFRSTPHFNHSSGWQYAWSHFGREYLIYMNGQTGEPYQITDFPLPRLEESEWKNLGVSGVEYNDYVSLANKGYGNYFTKNSGTLHKAWGDNYGHRSTKFFFGAPFLDGRKASLFLGRGIYTRHKMIAMDLDRDSHEWKELWRWNNNSSGSTWYGNGYHNFVVADVDEDGRDEIVYGSMVIDDNGRGLSTTGLGHGDAQHVSDFDPYRRGLEFFGCNEDKPGMNYRNATTSELYVRSTASKDDGRGLMGNFTNSYPGSVGRSVSSGLYSSVKDKVIESLTGDKFIHWGDLNFRIYWDGDLCSEILNSPGTAKEAKIEKPGVRRLFTSSGCNMNNDSKNNPCFQGDIIGDWREEIVVRHGGGLRVYTTGFLTSHSLPTLWNDHQYRQAMVWQMMAYNQPPHLSYFLGEMEGITVAPPTLTNDGRTEIENGGTISSGSNNDHLLICKTDNMTVNVSDGAAPAVLVVNTPTWVQGHDNNNNITTTTYTHTLTGGAFTGAMRLVKQGNGILQLPDVEETYTGNTDVWAGTLRFNGTMQNSAVWLNRFTTLETNGGMFTKSITADYGSTIAVGSEGITVGTLTLNYGARLVITLNNDLTASQVNVSQLVLNSKTGDVWENYGPKYLKPVVEFRAQSGSIADGPYDLGTISSFEDKAIIEGLGEYSFKSINGHLFLVVGTGVAVTCPEATFDISGYHSITNGILPIVSINPGTFSYGGSNVTPAVEGKFNGAPVDLLTLYNEDYENATDASAWTTQYATVELAAEKHINIIQGGGSGPRSAYTKFYTNSFYGDCNSYAIEFDAYFHYAHGNYGPNELVIYGEGARMPLSNALFSNPNYLFKMTGGSNYSTGYSVEGSSTSFSLNNYQWYHYAIHVDKSSRKVDYIITSDGGTVSSGSYDVTDNSINLNGQGFEVGLGRAYSQAGIDNIRIYRTDGYYYTFEESGTLTVTTSYPGCQSTTATYEVTEAIMPGDVNKDGKVNIVDVAVTISYMTTGQEPEGFVKAAADIDCNDTVDKADLDAIVARIGW